MSVVRWGADSDVYVFYHVEGGIECCACTLTDQTCRSFRAKTADEMIDHLLSHRAKGDKVPEEALETLRERIPG